MNAPQAAEGGDPEGEPGAGVAGETEEIGADDYLLRKIEDTPHLLPREAGGRRISKAAFSPSSVREDPEQGMSCNSEKILKREGLDPAHFAPATPVLARLAVKDLTDLGLQVVHRPLDDDRSHCNVLGVRDTHRKKLLAKCTLLRFPPDVHKN